jgi:hypothetical protein
VTVGRWTYFLSKVRRKWRPLLFYGVEHDRFCISGYARQFYRPRTHNVSDPFSQQRASQNYWVFGLLPSSGILGNRNRTPNDGKALNPRTHHRQDPLESTCFSLYGVVMNPLLTILHSSVPLLWGNCNRLGVLPMYVKDLVKMITDIVADVTPDTLRCVR